MITQCCIKALYDAGPSAQAATDMAKTFERRKCNHLDKPKAEDECMRVMAGRDNPHRYVVATQSLELRKHLRTVAGTPIIYLNRSVVLLEAPSDQTVARKALLEGAKLHAPKAELALLGRTPVAASNSSNLIDAPFASTSADPLEGPTLRLPDGAAAEQPPKKKKKQRGPSGPNPLSVKKAAKGPAKTEAKADMTERLARERVERKRKREQDGDAGAVRTLARAGGEGAARKRKRKSRKDGGDGVGSEAGAGSD